MVGAAHDRTGTGRTSVAILVDSDVRCFPMTNPTAFADGIGADMTRYLDMSVNQYWPLLPGANNITISGSSVRILWNNGWI